MEALDSALARYEFHPYRLQLWTYAFLHYTQTGNTPDLKLILVDARNRQVKELNEPFDLAVTGPWIDRRIDELIAEDEAFEKLKKRRRSSAKLFTFPFAQPDKVSLN